MAQYGNFLRKIYGIEEEHSGPTRMNNSVIKTNYNFRSLCSKKTKDTVTYHEF